MNGLERIVHLTPAYDLRDENKGVHGVDLAMYLKGEKGAVQFVLYTGWVLPKTLDMVDHLQWNTHPDYADMLSANFGSKGFYPMPADLGYHSHEPKYEDHWVRDDCWLLEGKCYYDGSSLNAIPVFDILLHEGHDGVWKYLEEYYNEVL